MPGLPPQLAQPVTDEHLRQFARSLSDDSRGYMLAYARRFIRECGSTSRGDIEAWFQRLRAQGYKSTTIRTVWFIVKSLFRVNGLPWPFAPHEAPDVEAAEQTVYMIDPEALRAMVLATTDARRVGRLLTAHLALASVYGLRREELANLTPDHLNLRDRVLYVQTVHGGPTRYHRIPEVLVPVLQWARPAIRPRGLRAMDREWHRLERVIGMAHVKGMGWHAVRHALSYHLHETGLPEAFIASFMRWASSERRMVHRYPRATVVGFGARQTLPLRDEEIDRAVFEVHPFLPYWAEAWPTSG